MQTAIENAITNATETALENAAETALEQVTKTPLHQTHIAYALYGVAAGALVTTLGYFGYKGVRNYLDNKKKEEATVAPAPEAEKKSA